MSSNRVGPEGCEIRSCLGASVSVPSCFRGTYFGGALVVNETHPVDKSFRKEIIADLESVNNNLLIAPGPLNHSSDQINHFSQNVHPIDPTTR